MLTLKRVVLILLFLISQIIKKKSMELNNLEKVVTLPMDLL